MPKYKGMSRNLDLDELRDELEELKNRAENADADIEEGEIPDVLTKEEQDRLRELTELDDEIDFDNLIRNGETIIPESDWLKYAEETMKDCYTIPKDIQNYIDYEKFADDLRADYSEFDWEGTTYLYRSC